MTQSGRALVLGHEWVMLELWSTYNVNLDRATFPHYTYSGR